MACSSDGVPSAQQEEENQEIHRRGSKRDSKNSQRFFKTRQDDQSDCIGSFVRDNNKRQRKSNLRVGAWKPCSDFMGKCHLGRALPAAMQQRPGSSRFAHRWSSHRRRVSLLAGKSGCSARMTNGGSTRGFSYLPIGVVVCRCLSNIEHQAPGERLGSIEPCKCSGWGA